jgi:pyruvate formate lyase activating enzyme
VGGVRGAHALATHPAEFARSFAGGRVECGLCEHYCRIEPGATGLCRVRHNHDGHLVTSAYGQVVALAVEPIEKKHLFHVFPGSLTLSLGTAGCNLRCGYCINWRVAQRGLEADDALVTPDDLVARALAAGVRCLAFTYTEPTIFFEYAQDLARHARRAGLAVVAKSNGYMTPGALERMADWLDALNVDLKAWQEPAHRAAVGGTLQPVLRNLRAAQRLGLWLEISTLIVPGLNDQPEDLRGMAAFIADELGPDVPWHLLRFFPAYKMSGRRVTAQACLQDATEIAQQAGLRYVYNSEQAQGRLLDTYCAGCQRVVLERIGLRLAKSHLLGAACGACGAVAPGVGMEAAFVGARPAPSDSHGLANTER